MPQSIAAYGESGGLRLTYQKTKNEGAMFQHILIPTDGTDLSRKAVLYGVQLARESKARITALTITEPYRVASMDAVLVSVGEDDYEEESSRVADQALDAVKIAADAAGVRCDAVREVHDQPYRAIIDTAHARNCDLIVMASHGRRGVSALLLGSETVKVITHSTIPVLVYR
jgi:nucleotide-binding universal stress UspA family protein